ncbi:GtrA family protein [Weissella fabalis]|uniref:GtrA family protein n=1 Tax=Periweissella fabalis TaxID=1070421 RepID=A0A7X6S3E7_9LACO|nr:GtrA family protein [Periweissella fabalis]NKZ24528.1 GtrA family protein [Periweissella fabalis]
MKLIINKYSSQLLYLVFGVLTTIVNIVVFGVGIKFGLNTTFSNILAWLLSVLVAYLTNRVWVFGSKAVSFGEKIREIITFFYYRGVTLLLDLAIIYVGVNLLHGQPLIWKIIDNVIVIILNYVLSKVFIFKNNKM